MALEFEVEDYTPPAPAAPAHVEDVEQLIAMGPDKVAKLTFPSEDAALATLKSWQAAARYLNVAVKRVSITAEPRRGKPPVVALRVRIGQRVTRTRKPKTAE